MGEREGKGKREGRGRGICLLLNLGLATPLVVTTHLHVSFGINDYSFDLHGRYNVLTDDTLKTLSCIRE